MKVITKVIKEAIKTFIGGVNAYPSTAEDINDGSCDRFAQFVSSQIAVSKCIWGDELTEEFWGIEDDCWMSHHAPYHCFIVFKGKYYDSESPKGVDHPKELIYYQKELGRYRRCNSPD